MIPSSSKNEALRAPFPWFGGKTRAAQSIWERLGNVGNYVEPFAGSLAVLLSRPHPAGIETVNDLDGFIANAWRAMAADPTQVAEYTNWPSNECCLHARHVWLKARRATLTAQLEGDPDYFDAKIAGWWLWGIAQWIGSGWCSETEGGPWHVQDGKLVRVETTGQGVPRQLLHLGNAGKGVSRKRLHLCHAGQGVSQKWLHTGRGKLLDWFMALQQRLRRVRVCCGDWQRVMGATVTFKHGMTGILLDPPYSVDERGDVYSCDSVGLAEDVRQWCLTYGDNPLLRIVLCGYETAVYTMPDTWTKIVWKTPGGLGNQGMGRGRANSARETLWFSPACLSTTQGQLFS